jgi:hypothetical protein
MGLRSARRRLLTVVAVLGAGGIASFAAGWRAPPVAELSPSDIVALRFSESLDEVPEASASADQATLDEVDERRLVLFSPYPLLPQAISRAEGPSLGVQTERQPAPQSERREPYANPQIAMKAEPATATRQAASEPEARARNKQAAAPVRSAHRSDAVLNDAQIASIKKRLHLTPDQEHMWPAVEASLRKLVYAKAPGAARGRAQASLTHAIDPNSAELQNLKSAAVPLVLSFDDDQKRELRTLVQVMGLEKLASQF